MQNWIKPGVKLIDMCEHLEETVRTLVEVNGLKAGQFTNLWNAITILILNRTFL